MVEKVTIISISVIKNEAKMARPGRRNRCQRSEIVIILRCVRYVKENSNHARIQTI
jgi:hypothetical protein